MLSAQEVLTILSTKETAIPAEIHRDNSEICKGALTDAIKKSYT